MKIAGMVVLAALSGWFVRGIRFEREPEPAPRIARAVVAQSQPVVAEAVPAIRHASLDAASLGERNLFAYRVREQPPVAQVVVPIEPVEVAQVPVAVAEQPPAPQPIPFSWRYIGTFGAPHNRVAAFKRDGDILTVRPGDRIGDFVLRSIGLESTEVEGPDGVRRIPLSADL